jgi:hypothetical protein
LIVESSKEKKKQKILPPKEKTTSLKKIQQSKSTYIYLTVLVSADIKEELPKSSVLINRVELLNYKISGIFLYLVE